MSALSGKSLTRPQLLVLGGGFGGAALIKQLERLRVYADADITWISEESYVTFNPMLAEVVGSSIFPEHVVVPTRQLTRHATFVMGQVTGIDTREKIVLCNTLKGEMHFPYDHAVLALGSRARLDLIPGMQESGLVLKTVGDALTIRNQLLRRVARMEIETDAELRRQLGHFVVIGGGFSGVETAGALVDWIEVVRHYYKKVRKDEVRITLLHNTDTLLPELPARLGKAALDSLMRRGVEVRLMTNATKISAGNVTLADGQVLATATAICTIGTVPNALLATLSGATVEKGRVVADGTMQVSAVAGLWAMGDCALVPNAMATPNAPAGASCPPTAQCAVAQGKCLAANLAAVLRGNAPRPFAWQSRGMMATVGHLRGVALVGPLMISGLPAWMLWRAYYLSQIPTLGRKIRIYVEWTWGMFFPPDITHMRFETSRERHAVKDDM